MSIKERNHRQMEKIQKFCKERLEDDPNLDENELILEWIRTWAKYEKP
jgi:hypothetical protein